MSRRTEPSKAASRAPQREEVDVEAQEPSPAAQESQSELPPGLYVTATPIGNARDITLRALGILKNCDAIVAEDTRVTAKLLAIHAIAKPLLAYNDNNAARERPRLLARLKQGERIALVSDAGTPLISDPGYKLVREALKSGISVDALPGPSALLVALVQSGLPSNRFFFAGFLPPRSGERRNALSELNAIPATLVFYESPQRLSESLADMEEMLGPRDAAVARELTKFHQEIKRASLQDLAREFKSAPPPKGEITIVVGPPSALQQDGLRLDSLLVKALAFMPVRAAADLVAEAIDVPRRSVYARALELKAARNE